MFDPPMWTLSAAIVGAALLQNVGNEALVREDLAPQDTVITLFRNGCERRCPVYHVVIFSHGTVIVEGHHYFRRPVLATSEIPVFRVLHLIDRFNAIGFFNLHDEFGYKGKGCTSTGNADGPNVITTIVTGGRGKSITLISDAWA